MRVAYLNSQFPSLSHTFIEREVRALEDQGVEVHTFSVRRPGPADVLDEHNREAARRTFYLLGDFFSLFGALVWGLVTRPWRLVATFSKAQRLSLPGMRARALHCAYTIEASKLTREMRKRGLSHVHVHMANNGAAIALLATNLDRELSYSLTIHGSAEFFDVRGFNLRAKAERALFVRCISCFCKAQVMAWTSPESWCRYHVVHCGVDLRGLQLRLENRSGPLRILTVGRLHPIKGYHLLLEACHRLDKEGVQWELDMVGSGPISESLKIYGAKLKITDNVRFSGPQGQSELSKHFNWADVLVVSSFMEGIPVVLMEAMARQIPVVSTDVGGVRELVEDGVNGLIVRAGSVTALATALRRLAGDRDLQRSLGANSRRAVADSFAIESVGAQMAELFSQYLKR